jgi:hypothetical protein
MLKGLSWNDLEGGLSLMIFFFIKFANLMFKVALHKTY